MGNSVNPNQATWIKNSGKKVICVPDRDKAGDRLIDIALQQGWAVSFPRPMGVGGLRGWWTEEVKDVAQAVTKYGKLYTLRSIIENSTNSRMKINLMRRS